MKPTSEQVRAFFLSWGLAPSEEPDDNCIGNSDGAYVINSVVYGRLTAEAEEKYGEDFRKWASRQIDATDGEFYLTAETWDDLEGSWEEQ